MGKKNKIYNELLSELRKFSSGQTNPAQQQATSEALKGLNFFQKGDYRTLPTGYFFDFKTPAENIELYKRASNVSQDGLFGLGDTTGQGKQLALQRQYLGDKFGRDAAANYEQNIGRAAQGVRESLNQASGASIQTSQIGLGTYGNLFNSLNKQGGGGLLGAIGQIGGGILSSFKPKI